MLTRRLFKAYFLSDKTNSVVRTISKISFFSLTISLFALVLVINVMSGFNESMQKKMLAQEPHVVIELDDKSILPRVETQIKGEGIDYFLFDQGDVVIKSMDGYFSGAIARGVELDEFESMVRGALPTEKLEVSEDSAVLGIDLARSLGVYEGDELLIMTPDYLLRGQGVVPKYDRVQVTLILPEQHSNADSSSLFYLRGRLPYLSAYKSNTSGVNVYLKNIDRADGMKESLQKEFLNQARVYTWKDRNSSLFLALKLEKISIGFFLAMSALIASFSVVTVLILLMTQKKKDIGLLMAIGYSKSLLSRSFIGMGLLLSFSGIFTGIALATGISTLMHFYPMDILPDIYIDRTLPVNIDLKFALWVTIASLFVVVITSVIAVYNTVKKTPAEALRGGSL